MSQKTSPRRVLRIRTSLRAGALPLYMQLTGMTQGEIVGSCSGED